MTENDEETASSSAIRTYRMLSTDFKRRYMQITLVMKSLCKVTPVEKFRCRRSSITADSEPTFNQYL